MTSDRDAKLIQAGLSLARDLSFDTVLQRIIDLATEVTGARYGALGVLDADGGGAIREFVTTGVTPQERAAIGHIPEGRGILGVLIRDAKPLRLADIGADPRAVGFPPNHPPMRSFLGAPVMARGRVFGNIYLTEKSGGRGFSAEDEEAVVILAAQAGVAVDNARLYEASRERERWLNAVREIAALILSGSETAQALELVAARAAELIGADFASIAIPTADGRDLLIVEAVGEHAEEVRGLVFPIEGSVSGEVIRFGRAAILEDAAADERTLQPLVRAGHFGPSMFVPMSARGRPFGTLAVANLQAGRPFGERDLRLIETFAAQAAVALEFDRAQRESQRLMVLEERERIAKELHDGVVQSLFAVGMGLQGAAALTPDPDLESRLESAVNEIDHAIRDLRNYIFGLRPGILADRQLDQAIRDLAREFEERSGVITVVDVDAGAAAELSSSAADLVQLTREALSNVERHAAAATCRVSLRYDGDRAVLEIDDDGKGFDPAHGRDLGHGIANFQGRAASLGGEAAVESAPGKGTTVRVTIPV